METDTTRCSNCGTEVRQDASTSLGNCPGCGQKLHPTNDVHSGVLDPAVNVEMNQAQFWVLLLGPQGILLVGTLMGLFNEVFMGLGSFLAFGTAFFSAVLCGRFLVRHMDAPRWRRQLFQFGISVGIFIIHFALMLTGCSLVGP